METKMSKTEREAVEMAVRYARSDARYTAAAERSKAEAERLEREAADWAEWERTAKRSRWE